MNLTDAYREMHATKALLAEHEVAAKKRGDELRRKIRDMALIAETATAGLDLEKIQAGKVIIGVAGLYERGGADRDSVISDAIKQLVTGVPIRPTYSDLWLTAFGTKDYDRWSGQRSDHPYGYGPRHGSTVFAVGLTGEVRRRESRELTPDEIEAAVYYLTNLARIQSAEQKARAA